jgi:hypothetical protein
VRASTFRFAAAFVLCSVGFARAAADAKWARMDTANFIVIGAIGEPRLRAIGGQFEGFREALTHLMSSSVTRTAVPNVVIAFPDQKAFQPFKPVYQGKPVEVGGLFMPRRDVNYILVGPETSSDALRPVFHEYAHVVVNTIAPELPVWLNEGLAEYYSTFQLTSDGRTFTFGRTIATHVAALSGQTWMPLKDVLATTGESPHYNEGSRRGMFYAEAWLLVHMLQLGQPNRIPAFAAYLRELANGTPPETAWGHQFDTEAMDKALHAYANHPATALRTYAVTDEIARAPAVVVPLPPQDLETTLGEVLTAQGKKDLAAARFASALALQPDAARATVGKAHASDQTPRPASSIGAPGDWFGDYMIGATLLEHSETLDRPSLDLARAALGRVVVARPELPNAYVLFAMASDKVDADPKTAVDALTKAHVAVPARDDYTITLAHALIRTGAFAQARSVLGSVIAHPHLPGARDLALKAMEQVAAAEQDATTRAAVAEPAPAPDAPSSAPSEQAVFRPVGAGERRVKGTLQRIDCSRKRVEFVVDIGDRVAHFLAAKMEQVEFISYRTDLQGSVGCGARTSSDPVYVTWRAGDLDGTVVAIEFLPIR